MQLYFGNAYCEFGIPQIPVTYCIFYKLWPTGNECFKSGLFILTIKHVSVLGIWQSNNLGHGEKYSYNSHLTHV